MTTGPRTQRIVRLALAAALTAVSYWALDPSGNLAFINWAIGGVALHASGALIWACASS